MAEQQKFTISDLVNRQQQTQQPRFSISDLESRQSQPIESPRYTISQLSEQQQSPQTQPQEPTVFDNVINRANDAVTGLYDSVADTWTRAGRGMALTYLPSSVVTQYADEDNPIQQPIWDEQLPLGIHNLYALADIGVEAVSGYNLPYADRAAEIAQLGEEGLTNMSGQDAPSNLLELGTEILAGGAMPVPAASRIPAAARFGMDFVSPIAPVRNLDEWGRFTIGTSLPGIGLMEGLDYSVDVPGYDGVFSNLTGEDPENIRTIDTQREQIIDPELEAADDRVDVSSVLLSIGAGVAGGAVAARSINRALGLNHYSQPTGTSVTDMERITTTLFDESHATMQQFGRQLRDQGFTPEQISQRQSEVITNRPVVVAADIQNFWNTGRLQTQRGEINLNTSPQRVSSELRSSPEATNMRRLIDLRDEMDNRIEVLNRARQGTSIRTMDRPMSVEARGMSMSDLRAEIQRLEARPEVRRVADEYSQIMEASLRYARDRGLITNSLFRTIRDAHPNFRPDLVIPQNGTGGVLRNLLERFNRIGQRSGFDRPIQERTLQPKQLELLDPVESMDRYISGLITDAEVNRTRRMFFESLGARHFKSENAAIKSARSKHNTDRPHDHIVEVFGNRNDNKPVYYVVDDPLVGNFLRQDSKQLGLLSRTLNSMRKAFQWGTTGPGNPAFAPMSMFYDMALAMRSGGKGVRTGYLPSAVSDLGIPDVTLPISMMEAFTRSIGANTSLGMSNVLYSLAVRDNGIVKLLGGKQQVRAFANLFQRYYDKSFVALANQDRALGGRFNVDWQNSTAKLSTLNVGTSTYRAYRASLDSIQNAVRMSVYIRNYQPNASFAQRRQLARTVREIGADFTKVGQSPAVQATLGTLPYANVGIQAFRQYAHVARDNPMLFATTTAAFALPTIMLVLEAVRRGPEHVDFLFNQLSITDRISNDYVIGDEGPQDFVRITKTLPEDTMARSVLYAWLDANFGFSTGYYNSDENMRTLDVMRMIVSPETWSNVPLEDIQQGLTAAAGRIIQPSIPPAANIALNLGGIQARPDRMFAGGGNVFSDINETHIPEGNVVSDTLHNARAEAILNNGLGLLASTMLDMAQEAERAITDEHRDIYDAAQAATDVFNRQSLNTIPTGQLWSNYVNRDPNYGDRIQRVNDKWARMNQINEQYRTYEQGSGDMARQRGMHNPRGTLTSMGPEFSGPAGDIRSFMSIMNRQTAPRDNINQLRDRIDSINQRTDLDLNEKTTMLNQAIREKAAYERELDYQIQMFERGLQQRHGVTIDDVAAMLR